MVIGRQMDGHRKANGWPLGRQLQQHPEDRFNMEKKKSSIKYILPVLVRLCKFLCHQ